MFNKRVFTGILVATLNAGCVQGPLSHRSNSEIFRKTVAPAIEFVVTRRRLDEPWVTLFGIASGSQPSIIPFHQISYGIALSGRSVFPVKTFFTSEIETLDHVEILNAELQQNIIIIGELHQYTVRVRAIDIRKSETVLDSVLLGWDIVFGPHIFDSSQCRLTFKGRIADRSLSVRLSERQLDKDIDAEFKLTGDGSELRLIRP